jgi:3-hydroxyacyl-[acyl-carrier-protein] dehydratase
MIDSIEVLGLLPHRYPILLVDRVLESAPPHRVVTAKAITCTELCYSTQPEGLGRSRCAYPPTLLLESFVQSCGILWRLGLQYRGEDLTGLLIFGSARDVVFHRSAFPGQTVRHVVQLDSVRGDNAVMSGESWVDDKKLATIGGAVAVSRPAEILEGAR